MGCHDTKCADRGICLCPRSTFHITIECSMAFARLLAGGKVATQVYANDVAKGGGINYRDAQGARMHVSNAGEIVAR